MISDIVLWYCISALIYYLYTFRLFRVLSKPRHVLIPNDFKNKQRLLFDCAYCGTAFKRKGVVHQFNDNTLYNDLKISLAGCKHFAAPGGVLRFGDRVLVEGVVEILSDCAIVYDVYLCIVTDNRLLHWYFHKLFSNISKIVGMCLICLKLMLLIYPYLIQIGSFMMPFLNIWT